METSKKLTWVLTIFFLSSITAIGAIKIIFSIDLSNLLNYIMPLETAIVLAYFGKSGVENVQKIRTNTNGSINIETPNTIIESNVSEKVTQ